MLLLNKTTLYHGTKGKGILSRVLKSLHLKIKKGKSISLKLFLNDTLQRGKMGGVGGLYYYKNKTSVPTDISFENKTLKIH